MRRLVFAASALAMAITGVVSLPTAPAHAQSACQATTPGAGTSARRQILNALRPQVEAMAREDVEFVVDRIRIACDWARVVVNPRAPGGQGNHYEPVDAVFQRSGGVWRVRETACGEVDCAPAAEQYRKLFPNLPDALLF